VIKKLGSGYKIIDDDGEDFNTPNNQILLKDIVSKAKKIRGDAISYSLDIDYYLNNLIGKFLFGTNTEFQNIFNDCILYKEFFTFSKKVDVLNFLLTNYPEKFSLKSEKKRKEIITKIKRVMECRNIFAHEEIVVSLKEKVAYIRDKNQQNLLTPESVNEFNSLILEIIIIYVQLDLGLTRTISTKSL
jgi:hypothetical protein